MFGMGQWEILIIFLVILLIFGAKRIPDMAQGLGKGIKEFRKAVRDVQDEVDLSSTHTNKNQHIEPSTPPNQVPHQSNANPTESPKQQSESS